MSYADEMMANREEVQEILFEIGAIKTCDVHDDYYYLTSMESGEIYGKATNLYKKKAGQEKVPKWFSKFVKEVLDDAGLSQGDCPFCAKIWKE